MFRIEDLKRAGILAAAILATQLWPSEAVAITIGPKAQMSAGFVVSISNSNGTPSNYAVTLENSDFSSSISTTGGGAASAFNAEQGYSCFGCGGFGAQVLAPRIVGSAQVVDGGGTATVDAIWNFDIVIRQTDVNAPNGIDAIVGISWIQPGTIGTVMDAALEEVTGSWGFFAGRVTYFDRCFAPIDLGPPLFTYLGCDGIYPNFPDQSGDGFLVSSVEREISIPARISLLLTAASDAPFPVPAPGAVSIFLAAAGGLVSRRLWLSRRLEMAQI